MKNRFVRLLGAVCASVVLPASAQTPSPDAHPPIVGREPGHVRVLFGGDTCYGESYHEQYAREGGTNIIALKGYDYSVVNLNRLLAAVDFRVLNLETPLTARRDTPYTNKDYIHYSDPVKLPAIFGHYGPIAYSLANNHTLDEGPGGLDDTVAALTAAHAQWFGAGDNLAEATRPMLQKINCGNGSFTLAVFGGFEYGKKYDKQFHFYAGPDKPGTAPVDIPAAKAEIAKLRQQVPDAFVVYFVHREDNYHWKNEAQEAMLHGLREAGVDLVICAGAHMLQEAEWDGRGWIFYGIGNFLFNARGRYAAFHAPPFGMPLVVDFTMKDGKVQTAFRGYPTLSDNQISGYQPRFVTEPELSAIDALLTEKSGWDTAERAAVTRGQDEVGRYLEFSTPKPPAK